MAHCTPEMGHIALFYNVLAQLGQDLHVYHWKYLKMPPTRWNIEKLLCDHLWCILSHSKSLDAEEHHISAKVVWLKWNNLDRLIQSKNHPYSNLTLSWSFLGWNSITWGPPYWQHCCKHSWRWSSCDCFWKVFPSAITSWLPVFGEKWSIKICIQNYQGIKYSR